MEALVREYLPHAPKLGLYAVPHLDLQKVRNALADYAKDVRADEVLALYDATLLGNARDGAVFTADRFVFQNNDLEPPQVIRYEDLVRVHTEKKLLGGRKVHVDANRGHATVAFTLDFSGKPQAATYVAKFLHEVMHHTPVHEDATTDVEAVEAALADLRRRGLLTPADYERLRQSLRT